MFSFRCQIQTSTLQTEVFHQTSMQISKDSIQTALCLEKEIIVPEKEHPMELQMEVEVNKQRYWEEII